MSSDPLVLASDITGRVVVSIDTGDDLAEVRDVVFDPVDHGLIGFTLNKRGWFRGRLKRTLPTEAVAAIGPDAILTDAATDLVHTEDSPEELTGDGDEITVIGTRVLTEHGDDLGEISDVVLETGPKPQAVGYRVRSDDREVFVPIGAQLSLSEDYIVLPPGATDFVRNDLTGFGAAVEAHRALLDDTEERHSS